jgi:aminoglycoside 6'-N-acetyltransferase I
MAPSPGSRASCVIDELDASDSRFIDELAQLSFEAARRHAPNWLPSIEAARQEVVDATADGHVTRVAFSRTRTPVGWVSAHHLYGQAWELHPLLVAVDQQGRGFGRALVVDLERHVAGRGGGVLTLSTSDEVGGTSLFDRDLYDDPLAALVDLQVHQRHAVGFWLRIGYRLVGVTPDAEGPGKPSIHFAKRPVASAN